MQFNIDLIFHFYLLQTAAFVTATAALYKGLFIPVGTWGI